MKDKNLVLALFQSGNNMPLFNLDSEDSRGELARELDFTNLRDCLIIEAPRRYDSLR